MPQPRQRASAVVGARVATANTALAAIAISIFFMGISKMRPARRRSQDKLVWPKSSLLNNAWPICRKFGGGTQTETDRRLAVQDDGRCSRYLNDSSEWRGQ
jgi:hypothetical protein